MDRTRPPGVLLARDLVAQGYGYDELARLVRRGELEHLRRGAYEAAQGTELDAVTRHRRLALATVPLLSAGVVSHRSAAVLHGLPLPAGGLDRVQVTRPDVASGRRRGHVHRFAAPLEASEVVVVDGLPVTSVARTVVDLGRLLPHVDAVAVADAALRGGLDRLALDEAVRRARGRPGVGAARRAAGFADGRSESVGESQSRVLLHQIGLAPTDLQHEVPDDDGRIVGRSDFAWPERRTLGEFDGRVKYGRLLRPGQSPGDAVWAEKLREDALRDLGWQVVRWCWADLARPGLIADRLHRAFARSRR